MALDGPSAHRQMHLREQLGRLTVQGVNIQDNYEVIIL